MFLLRMEISTDFNIFTTEINPLAVREGVQMYNKKQCWRSLFL